MTRPSRRMFPHRCTILTTATERRSATGGLAPIETVVAEDVACLIVRKAAGRQTEGLQEMEKRKIRVYFPDNIHLTERHRIRFTTAAGLVRELVVDDFDDDLNLGRLFYATCEEQVDCTEG